MEVAEDQDVLVTQLDTITFDGRSKNFRFLCVQHGTVYETASGPKSIHEVRWNVARHYTRLHKDDAKPKCLTDKSTIVAKTVPRGTIEPDKSLCEPMEQFLRRKAPQNWSTSWWLDWGVQLTLPAGTPTAKSKKKKAPAAVATSSATENKTAVVAVAPSSATVETKAAPAKARPLRGANRTTRIVHWTDMRNKLTELQAVLQAVAEGSSSAPHRLKEVLLSLNSNQDKRPSPAMLEWELDGFKMTFAKIREMRTKAPELVPVLKALNALKAKNDAHTTKKAQAAANFIAEQDAKKEILLQRHAVELQEYSRGEKVAIVEDGGASHVILLNAGVSKTYVQQEKKTQKLLLAKIKSWETIPSGDNRKQYWKDTWGVCFDSASNARLGHFLHLEPKLNKLIKSLKAAHEAKTRELPTALRVVYDAAFFLSRACGYVAAFNRAFAVTQSPVTSVFNPSSSTLAASGAKRKRTAAAVTVAPSKERANQNKARKTSANQNNPNAAAAASSHGFETHLFSPAIGQRTQLQNITHSSLPSTSSSSSSSSANRTMVMALSQPAVPIAMPGSLREGATTQQCTDLVSAAMQQIQSLNTLHAFLVKLRNSEKRRIAEGS
jgi:hypothetical protein